MEIRKSLSAVLIVGAAMLIAAPARAEIVSSWSESLGARARLIAGSTGNGNLAGIQIILEDGWRTYWKNAGDGGIPPAFNWAGSQNLADAEVQFPVPQRYQDSYGTSMGYTHAVVFPIALQIIDPGKPVVISVTMDYAVCEKLCVPAQAELSLEIPAGLSVGYSQWLQQSLDQVPEARSADDASIESLQIAVADEKSWLEITARYPGKPTNLDLFIEGPESWYLPAPMQVSLVSEGDETLVGYRVDLYGVPGTARLEGAQFLFTIVADNRAVEQQWTLD